MHMYQLSEFKRVQSDQPILSAKQWLDIDGQYIIVMLHPDNKYSMEVASKNPDSNELIDKHFESIKNWYNIERIRVNEMF